MKLCLMRYCVAFACVFFTATIYAEGSRMSIPNNPKWKEECGSCHIAYPPQLLTPESWQQVMGSLDKHFGANALLDAKDNKEILDYLQRYAGTGSRHSSPSARISETQWFIREHREVSGDSWSNPAVKSRANCTACHVTADKGDWSERGIRMPRGLKRGDDD